MSIQMTLVFGLMTAEMAYLLVLLLPLPFAIRKKILQLSEMVKSSQRFKVTLIFFTILLGMQFMDCLNRLKKLEFQRNPYFTQDYQPQRISYDQLASKFYSQRNLYITGAVLYLELSIFTVMKVFKKIVLKEESFRSLLSKVPPKEDEEVEKYKSLIKKKQLDIDTFRKQIEGLQASYDDLNKNESEYDKKTE
ncbi:uncharacterized protein PRCAT00004781001 [Priceomyces carsonii]|uniref:uncharacterized protein n=1 Tax=Priceomyces carsonii TaxID=28549 RepID=UPI002ED9E7D3|nr:unnamed protein product [Priceomyces carsonii]